MTGQPRIPLDDLTSDALDQLYAELELAKRVARSAARDAELALTQYLVAEANRDRYRHAWQSARQRAEAYGEGIMRLCDDRDTYAGWLEQEQAHSAALRADNARLTAGQCLDSRAMCEQHHAPPVAGCPYPRCRAARGDQPTPAPRTPGVIDLPDISTA
ncbi:hypothetical protein IFE09_27145 [Streptomyces microflavus]|nr:hypothetical protein [Streptomyces microflavus]QQZ56878.1 hypothetical protein IFE09_27145 [Streptomyces microflavus]